MLALIWGSVFLWIKLADRGCSAVEVTLARLALGAAVPYLLFAIAERSVDSSNLECLAASISYIHLDRFLAHRGFSSVTLSACQLLAASVMLGIALAVTGAQAPKFTAESIGAIVVLGIIGSGFA